MTRTSPLLAASLLSALARAQQIGTAIPEVHPRLTTYKCTLADGCKPANTSIVLDAGTRALHKVDDLNTACRVNGELCRTAEACGANCALEGIPDYKARGIEILEGGDALRMHQWMPNGNGGYTETTPRAYLVSEDGEKYENLQLLGKEISFDADVSHLPCGMNGAFYLSEMLMDGGRGPLNPAGAKYGTGYCDAQCFYLDWINGEANINNTHGACCNEMDIWEANARANTFVPHPCTEPQVYRCTGETECGQPEGVCDKWGCGYNQYAHGVHDFYGNDPPKTVDTNRKFTVTTQFVAANDELVEIRRSYAQDGKTIANAAVSVSGGALKVDSITDAYCEATAEWTQQRGGIKGMGEAFARGMVLVFSIWADAGGYMNWLDSGNAGPCNETEGNPREIVKHSPDAHLIFSNIRWGEIGSTTGSE